MLRLQPVASLKLFQQTIEGVKEAVTQALLNPRLQGWFMIQSQFFPARFQTFPARFQTFTGRVQTVTKGFFVHKHWPGGFVLNSFHSLFLVRSNFSCFGMRFSYAC